MPSENAECLFEIDTGKGWEKSLTKILSSFEDPVYDIHTELGYAYVKGKTNRHQILKKLKKGGKHAELKRITFQGDSNNNSNNNNYTPLAKMGPLYDPNRSYYYANDPYNYHSYANYNPWHHSNHLLMNKAPNYGVANNHYPPSPLHTGRGFFHPHHSSVLSSSTSSSIPSSSSRQMTEPEQPPRSPVREPLRSGPFRRLGFLKEVIKVFSIKKVTRKFRSFYNKA